jgi:D-amino-acid dehydrogenase
MTPPPTPDVVVVGGGLVGSALAYELVEAGADTILVDRHDQGRATDAGAGILSPETHQDPDPDTFAIGMASARHYPGLVERLAEDGVAESGFAVTGSLLVAERPGDDEFMERAVGLAGRRSPGLEEIDPGEAVRHFPPLGPVRRALYNPDGRRVDGRSLTAALRTAAVARGLRVVGAGVESLTLDRPGATVEGVVTSQGPLGAGAVAICGGAWSPAVAEDLGVRVPVHPLKGQIVHLWLPDTDSASWPIVQPVLGFYLVPWPDGRVACGGTMEAAAGFDHRPTADGLLQLLRECLRTAPGLAQATVADVRVGLRPASSDGLPVVGRVPGWSNAYVATGHGAEGLLLGPLTARVLAGLMVGAGTAASPEGNVPTRMLERWSPGRFTPGDGV